MDGVSASPDAYRAAGYNYGGTLGSLRVERVLPTGVANAITQGTDWEGTFTTPVCDISSAINSTYELKDITLQPHSHDRRAAYLGPICDGDVDRTTLFMNAANLFNFQSPKQVYTKAPRYSCEIGCGMDLLAGEANRRSHLLDPFWAADF